MLKLDNFEQAKSLIEKHRLLQRLQIDVSSTSPPPIGVGPTRAEQNRPWVSLSDLLAYERLIELLDIVNELLTKEAEAARTAAEALGVSFDGERKGETQ